MYFSTAHKRPHNRFLYNIKYFYVLELTNNFLRSMSLKIVVSKKTILQATGWVRRNLLMWTSDLL